MSAVGVTTKKHFDIFRKEVDKWVIAFGLLDWDIKVEHGGVEDDNAAECSYNIQAKGATIRLSKNFTWDEHFTLNDIKEAAFHEVGELLLCQFGYLAENRYITQEQIESARHGILARLLNCVFRKS